MSALGLATLLTLLAPDAFTQNAPAGAAPKVLRVGHFPNVTHAQGVIAHQLTRQGKGWFEQRLGPDIKIEWFVYNAGPSAMEAMLTGALDLTYVGPNPAINAFVRSGGEGVRIVSGAALGGSGLVVQGDGRIAKPSDFKGKRLATPQLGNTQDIAARAWLQRQGFRITQTGGDVKILPTANPDQLLLFQKGDIDAVWTVEPWVSRLEMEAGAKLFLEEDDGVTTVLTVNSEFLRKFPDTVARFVGAHTELTQWMLAHEPDAKALLNAEILAETSRGVPKALLDRAWPRIRFTTKLDPAALDKFMKDARQARLVPETDSIAGLVQLIEVR